MDNKTPQQRRAERQKYMRIQRIIRMCAILLAIVLSLAALIQSCAVKKAVEDLAAQMAAKKAQEAAAAAVSPSPSPSPEPEGEQITLSFVGDCTLGMDQTDAYEGCFPQYYDEYGAGYFFQNVKSIFEGDDLTVANLEGTFTASGNRADKLWTFRGDPSYASILTEGGIDAVNVANDHTDDYGDEGYVDTLANLDNAGIGRFGYSNELLVELAPDGGTAGDSAEEAAGITVGLAGYSQAYDDYAEKALSSVQSLRDDGADIVIISLHWGTEYEYAPDEDQVSLAHQLIDAGADLVVGHNSHVLQGIEYYHGKYIAYSLGTFCFGGSDNPPDYDTVILRQTFTLADGAVRPQAELELIPCSISSQSGSNTCCPTPASGTEAQRILDKLYTLSAEMEYGIEQETNS